MKLASLHMWFVGICLSKLKEERLSELGFLNLKKKKKNRAFKLIENKQIKACLVVECIGRTIQIKQNHLFDHLINETNHPTNSKPTWLLTEMDPFGIESEFVRLSKVNSNQNWKRIEMHTTRKNEAIRTNYLYLSEVFLNCIFMPKWILIHFIYIYLKYLETKIDIYT